MEGDSHLLRTEVCQAIQDSVRVGRQDRMEKTAAPATGPLIALDSSQG